MGNCTACMSLIAPITDIRSPVKPVASFFHKILTVLVACRAGGAFDITEYDLAADIFLLAMKTVDAKIFGIQEKPPARIEVG